MKAISALLLVPTLALHVHAQNMSTPKNELAFGLGGIPSISRGESPSLDLGPGVALQVNYARRILDGSRLAFYGEINFVANPLRDVSSTVTFATRNVASLWVTPGLRVKAFPHARVSPYFAVGGGYADFEQSTTRLDGAPNSAPRQLGRGALDFGGGADFRIWRVIALRGEARDYFSGEPAYNVAAIRGGQNTVIALGAIVLSWH